MNKIKLKQPFQRPCLVNLQSLIQQHTRTQIEELSALSPRLCGRPLWKAPKTVKYTQPGRHDNRGTAKHKSRQAHKETTT